MSTAPFHHHSQPCRASRLSQSRHQTKAGLKCNIDVLLWDASPGHFFTGRATKHVGDNDENAHFQHGRCFRVREDTLFVTHEPSSVDYVP